GKSGALARAREAVLLDPVDQRAPRDPEALGGELLVSAGLLERGEDPRPLERGDLVAEAVLAAGAVGGNEPPGAGGRRHHRVTGGARGQRRGAGRERGGVAVVTPLPAGRADAPDHHVVGQEAVAAAQEERPLDDVLELADVTRPGVPFERRRRLLRDRDPR